MYKSGFLMEQGGAGQQPALYPEIMGIMDDEFQKVEEENRKHADRARATANNDRSLLNPRNNPPPMKRASLPPAKQAQGTSK